MLDSHPMTQCENAHLWWVTVLQHFQRGHLARSATSAAHCRPTWKTWSWPARRRCLRACQTFFLDSVQEKKKHNDSDHVCLIILQKLEWLFFGKAHVFHNPSHIPPRRINQKTSDPRGLQVPLPHPVPQRHRPCPRGQRRRRRSRRLWRRRGRRGRCGRCGRCGRRAPMAGRWWSWRKVDSAALGTGFGCTRGLKNWGRSGNLGWNWKTKSSTISSRWLFHRDGGWKKCCQQLRWLGYFEKGGNGFRWPSVWTRISIIARLFSKTPKDSFDVIHILIITFDVEWCFCLPWGRLGPGWFASQINLKYALKYALRWQWFDFGQLVIPIVVLTVPIKPASIAPCNHQPPRVLG